MSQLPRNLSLLATTLLNVSALFGKDGTPHDMNWHPNPPPAMSAYNAPSRTDVVGSWDLFLTGNFIYWNPSQENLELGIVSDTSDPFHTINGNVVIPDFDYAPGFQVGIGMNLDRDSWDLYFQYTWFRSKDTTTTDLDPASNNELHPLIAKPEASAPKFFFGQEVWRLSMDLFDLELARNYYVGTSLTFRPFFGARSALIRQDLDVDYRSETTGFLFFETSSVDQKTRSWAVGPRTGLNTNWALGKGLRLFGAGSADILFTQYSTLDWSQTGSPLNFGALNSLSQPDAHYLRTHLDLEFGFGWGMYFANNKSYVDLSASYGFQVFFGQNMFRTFTDDVTFNSFIPSGDLFIHGLTAAARFDF